MPAESETGKTVSLAGRMMSKRVMGKASFAHLRDKSGDIQIFAKRDVLGEDAYAAFKKLDVGDVIGCQGEVFRTRMGELSVRVTGITLLSKSLQPLPEKFHGLTDREARYRQRYGRPHRQPGSQAGVHHAFALYQFVRDFWTPAALWKSRPRCSTPSPAAPRRGRSSPTTTR